MLRGTLTKKPVQKHNTTTNTQNKIERTFCKNCLLFLFFILENLFFIKMISYTNVELPLWIKVIKKYKFFFKLILIFWTLFEHRFRIMKFKNIFFHIYLKLHLTDDLNEHGLPSKQGWQIMLNLRLDVIWFKFHW